METATLTSRGQIVIPQSVREELHLHEGEKFIVIGKEDTIFLKKIEMPSAEEFEKLLKKTREFAKKKGLKPSDVEEAIKNVRRR